MIEKRKTFDIESIKKLLIAILSKRVGKDSISGIEATGMKLQGKAEKWEFFSSFSSVPRLTGKEKLKINEVEKKKADELRPGWDLSEWTADQIGRTYLILCVAQNEEKVTFLEKIDKLFITSDMNEAVALYKSLPVLPYPDSLKARAAEGIRSNMTTVFKAVALRNPYPSEYLDEDAWNQLVLKALFVGSPLYLIQGIDNRANKRLAEMLVEYAHERWSASRQVSPELWRPVGAFINENSIEDIKKVLNHPEEIQKQAAVLALSASPHEAADELMTKFQQLADTIKDEQITWQDIGKQYHNQ